MEYSRTDTGQPCRSRSVREYWLTGFWMETVAPGMTAPDGSVTTPLIEPELDWAEIVVRISLKIERQISKREWCAWRCAWSNASWNSLIFELALLKKWQSDQAEAGSSARRKRCVRGIAAQMEPQRGWRRWIPAECGTARRGVLCNAQLCKEHNLNGRAVNMGVSQLCRGAEEEKKCEESYEQNAPGRIEAPRLPARRIDGRNYSAISRSV